MITKLFFKKAILCLLMAGTGLFAACSSDDEELKEVKVDFKLLNEKGEVTTTFAEGENITFDISVVNRSDETVAFANEDGDALYISQLLIFSEEGFLENAPWDVCSNDGYEYNLRPNQSTHWRTCYMINEVDNPALPPFEVTKTKDVLPKGNYYTELLYMVGGENRKVRKEFTIN